MKKILVANRGEIAVRIMRTCREMGIETVAIYSEVDRNAPHVHYAEEAVYIGVAPSKESYLLGDKIIQAAKDLGAEGIHPGYGFLSENADFSRAVTEAGLIFIGPRPKAIRIMGSKLAAKEALKDYPIPMVPGTAHALADVQEAMEVALELGYPVLIKASAGGGGKGMRIVEREEDLAEQMQRAVSEAQSAFGDGSVFIEKYVSSPRHIEIQVLADTHGNSIHLFERECSIQRRHQKVVEEAPSVVLSAALRAEMGRCAVEVARACDYVGAGTVEFLFDAQSRAFYFLEMNTRLQVEHPVTELITGVDLVRQQILIARGEELALQQDKLKMQGHAIELRVYAEDPTNNFLPSIGRLTNYSPPKGIGLRVDDGYREGMDVSIYYDPMIAKLITYGADRNEAIVRMLRAIQDYRIDGVATTLDFGRFAIAHEAFVSGQFDTHFVKKYFKPEFLNAETEEEAQLAATLAAFLMLESSQQQATHSPPTVLQKPSNWKRRKRL